MPADPMNSEPETGNDAHAARLDRSARVLAAQTTGGLSPSVLTLAWADWWMHLATAPGKRMQLTDHAIKGALQLLAGEGVPGPADPRFASPLWDQPPYAMWRDAFLRADAWWQEAVQGVHGMTPGNAAQLAFALRQGMDAASPTNNPALNPEVLARLRQSGGASLIEGARNLMDSLARQGQPAAPSDPQMQPGKALAATPGKVVARTHLMELIQYTPTTPEVHPEPVLIIPAWIMKYYILDLSAQNSLVRWLVAQGHTVFMISWRNPGAEDAGLGMADYLEQGPRAALRAVQGITGAGQVHLAGYCLGGTLLAILAADLARKGDEGRLASVTLLAAQVDFSEPGELGLFISEAQVTLLEDLMAEQGYLDGAQMAGAFTLLHSRDLLWSRLVREALLGERYQPNDLMVWNADATRLPAKMHSEYLRGLFLDNALSSGRFRVDGTALSLSDIRVPVMAIGAETDHVAPWTSVWKIHHLTKGDVTFILTKGGHNAGILSEPCHAHRHYRIATTRADQHPGDPQGWLDTVEMQPGSWWPAWSDWLKARSGPPGPLPTLGNAEAGLPVLGEAPGSYVFQH